MFRILRQAGVVLMVLVVSVVAHAEVSANVFEIDPAHSSANFKVKHLGVSNVRGVFTDLEGVINLDQDNPSNSSVKVVIKVESVDTNNKKRDDHLRSDDFFDAAKFTEMSFVSTEIKKIDDENFEVSGDFSLHGVTRNITVEVEKVGEGDDPWGGHRVGFETEFNINRSDYEMGRMIPVVGDNVKITFSCEAVKKKAEDKK